MKTNDIQYGNVTLGQLARFCVETAGKDALLAKELLTESTINDAYKEKGSFTKFRFVDKDSIFGKIHSFYDELEAEFHSNGKTTDLYVDFITHEFFEAISVLPVPEFRSADIAKCTLFTLLDNNIRKTLQFCAYLMYAQSLDFASICDSVCGGLGITLAEFYRRIAGRMQEKMPDAEESVQRALQKCRKDDTLPRWDIFYPLLQTVYTDCGTGPTDAFLTLYFYRNCSDAVRHLGISRADWQEFRRIVPLFKDSPSYYAQAFSTFMKPVNDRLFSGVEAAAPAKELFSTLIERNERQNIAAFYASHALFRTALPHLTAFAEQWFCGKDYVYRYAQSGDTAQLKQALSAYKTAFSRGKYSAGVFLRSFLLEALAVGFYYDTKSSLKQARDRIAKAADTSNADTKTPLSANTKPFYDFAYALGLLPNEMEDAYNGYYFFCENFWKAFPAESGQARQLQEDDLLLQGGFTPQNEEDIRAQLAQVTGKTINTRLQTARMVAYTPLSSAIMHGEWDFVRLFLDRTKFPELDMNIPNTNNSYPVTEFLTKCKHPLYAAVFHNRWSIAIPQAPSREELYSLYREILARSETQALRSQTNRRKVSPMQEALESFDADIVRPLVQKICGSGCFPEDFRIDADELSPLYYAISLKHRIKIGPRQFLEDGKHNINWKNLAMAGLTAQEKHEKLRQQENDPIYKMIVTMKEERWHKAEQSGMITRMQESMDAIIDLLLEHTADVDDFVYFSQKDSGLRYVYDGSNFKQRRRVHLERRQGVNALFLAAETDDAQTCRKLLSRGADICRTLGEFAALNPLTGQSIAVRQNIIYRAADRKAWNVLELLLTEYAGRVRPLLQRQDADLTPFVYFLVHSLHRRDSAAVRRFVPLFAEAGAHLDESTAFGSAQELLRA